MSDYLQEACYLILLFFVFSVLGWVMEVVLKYRQYHRLINRGFLIGPYCPIYGAGVVFITVMVRLFSGVETSVGTTFTISFVGCGTLEYAVSYYLEKRFHARWWDYSNKPMNLHGRIWIGNLLLFGVGGTVIIEVIHSVVYSVFYRIPDKVLYPLAVIIVVVMSTDYLISHFIMRFVKTSVENSEADNTESISKEIRMLLSNKSVLHRRIADAYPEVIYRTDRINQKMKEIRVEMERMQKEAAENLEHIEQEAAESVERIRQETGHNLEELRRGTPVQLQAEIIQEQDQLIAMLTAETADREAIASKQESIQEKKLRLEEREKRYRLYQGGMKKN